MCSLFLCLLLCLANFSVVANAAENLVDKNLSNWIRADEDSSKSLSISTSTSGSTVTNKISISGTVDSIYDTAIIYSLPNLTIGESYRFTLQFDFDNETEILIEGRHDICLCPRIIPVVEAMSAITLLDLFLQNKCSNFYKDKGISKL